MTRKMITAGTYVAAAVLSVAVAPKSLGQAAPAATPAAEPTASEEEVVVLSPFVVSAENSQRYLATDTLAGTRIRTELKDVGSAISVITGEFLRDTGARNNQDLLVYTTGTEVGGIAGNFAGLGNGQMLDDTNARMNPNGNTRVRGLAEADNTRDFFLTDIPWDSFNVGRVDLQRGANAMLFGVGSPAGIVNSSTNAAAFSNENTVEFRYGSYGSARGSLDFNRVLLDDELAVRVAALDDHTKYRQRPAYQRDERLYAALRYDPKFMRFEGARTTFKMNYEKGDVDANRPRTIPPGDTITPWFSEASLKGLVLYPNLVGQTNVATVTADNAAGIRGTGVRQSSLDGGVYNPNYNPRIGSFGRNYGGIVAVFADPNSSDFSMMRTDIGTAGGLKSDGTIDGGIGGIPWTIMSGLIPFKEYAAAIGMPDANYGLYKNYCLQDETVFDFYNNLLDGPNKREWSNHEAFNASMAQTFLDNRVGFEAVYDHQTYERGQVNMMTDFGQSITLDRNFTLADGSLNPNFNRACIVSDGYSNNTYHSQRESWRVTAFGEFRFSDVMEKNLLSNILGRHVFTGLLSGDRVDIEQRNWFLNAADISYGVTNRDMLLRNRGVNILTYIGDPVIEAHGAYLPRLTALQVPTSGTLHWFDSTWNSTVSPGAAWTDQYGNASTQSENPANYVGWTNRAIDVISEYAGDRDSLVTNASLRRTKLDSKAVTMQSYFWDGTIVGTAGVRRDSQKSWALNQGPKNPDGSETIDLYSNDYRLPETGTKVTGTSKSYSVMVHTPKAIRSKLPWNTGISLFFNKSQNFQPASGRVDCFGNPLASPNGKTRDYGFVLTTWDDKVSLKVNWYRTEVKNAALSAFSGDYMLPAAEAWGYMYARRNLERFGDFGTSNSGLGGYGTMVGQSAADAIAIGDAVCNAYLANLNSDAWFANWGIDKNQWNSWMNWTTPQGWTITGDTTSKGIEYELNIAATKNLNISINASKTEATRTNMAESLATYVEDRWALYNTPVMLNGVQVGYIGDVRLWGPGYNPNETIRGKFGREFMSGYTLYRMQEGSNVPELRPWRFNLVANYSFDKGFMKGFNVGVGYRWQDGVVTGYKLTDAVNPNTGMKDYDLENPYVGPSETNVDAWVGYSRKLTEKIDWHIQLNLRNITTKKELIPITVQPDGTMAVGRIPETFSWTLTNTFKF